VRHLLVSVLAISLSGSPALAQSLRGAPAATPLQDSARVEAFKVAVAESAQSDDYRPGGMKPGYFWGGIGLMAAGAAWLTSGALVSTTCSSIAGLEIDCGGVSKVYIIGGAGLLAAGAVVFMMGKKEAKANPQISWTPHGVAVRNTFKF
jgi:hypothetical protein